MGFKHIRVGTVNNPNHRRVSSLHKRATCSLYKYPTYGTTLDSLESVNIQWDTSCLDTSKVDIYLNAPTTEVPQLHLWKSVDYSTGSYQADLKPRWWNSTDSQQLQFIIIEAGNPTFAATLPAGPIFTATYAEPDSGVPEAADTTVTDSNTTSGSSDSKSSMSKGSVAAAVIIPLLVVGLLIAGYIKWQRNKREDKTKRYSTAVDKRMSTINPDWASMSAAGATAAIRQSMAGSGNRNSGFSFGGIRPTSSFYAVEDGGQAGIGARGMYQQSNEPISVAHPRQNVYTADPAVRTSTISFAPEARPRPRAGSSVGTGERVSRVSFAADSRPSAERVSTFGRPSVDTRASTYTGGRGPSRAFHSAFVVPDLPPADDGAMSPTQRQGPMSLTPEAIQARLSTSDRGASEMSNDDMMPALNMMRAQAYDEPQYAGYFPEPEASQAPASAYGNDTLFSAPLSPTGAQSPEPIHSMFSGFAPAPAAPMSPDALLHRYAADRQARTNGMMSPPPGSPIQFPMPIATGNAVPASPQAPARVLSPSQPGVYSPSRGAYGVGHDESPYSGAI